MCKNYVKVVINGDVLARRNSLSRGDRLGGISDICVNCMYKDLGIASDLYLSH